jgi:Family of unknown function (DUF5677)
LSDKIQEFNLIAIQNSFLKCVGTSRDAIQEILSATEIADLEYSTLRNFSALMSDRSQAICFLLFNGFLWDAEIVLRSFYEANAKIWFICYRDRESRINLLHEFWGDYATMHNVKNANRSKKAQEIANQFGGSINEQIFKFLQREDVFPRSTENKDARRKLEQKWSFSEILHYLDSTASNLSPLKEISSLSHMYGLMSHLAHSDNVALDLMRDTATRDPEVRRLKEISQICRVLSDVCSMWIFSFEAIQFSQGADWNRNSVMWTEWQEFHKQCEPAKQAFFESQREFYERS